MLLRWRWALMPGCQKIYIAFVRYHLQPGVALTDNKWLLDDVSVSNAVLSTNTF